MRHVSYCIITKNAYDFKSKDLPHEILSSTINVS